MSRVVVLGSKIKQDLFGESDALGERIKLTGIAFRVIGVMKERGSALFFDWDALIYLPLKTLQKQVMGVDHVSFMVGTMVNPAQDGQTKTEIESLLRLRHGIMDPDKDDFAVVTQAETQAILDNILSGVTLLLIVLASISLLVGGVGIMNIMYVSVTERVYEIGLRKSVGARRRDILWQFLWEAVMMTVLGGLFGVAVGILLSWGISAAAQVYNFNWHFVIPWWGLSLAVAFSMAVGLIFGYYPARSAARLNPITALHKE